MVGVVLAKTICGVNALTSVMAVTVKATGGLLGNVAGGV